MKPALIFLNGYYDKRHFDFYHQEIEKAMESHSPLICADGGIRIFNELNQRGDAPLRPDILIGDMDSVQHQGFQSPHTSKTYRSGMDWTDRQRLY